MHAKTAPRLAPILSSLGAAESQVRVLQRAKAQQIRRFPPLARPPTAPDTHDLEGIRHKSLGISERIFLLRT